MSRCTTRRTRRLFRPDDRAISPVVGMIFVLAISVVSVGAMMSWGLPAIDKMKAMVEVRAAEAQLREFNDAVRELAAGSPGKTAKRWTPSLDRGSIQIVPGGEPWIILVNKAMYNTATPSGVPADPVRFNFTLAKPITLTGGATGKGDNTITLRNDGDYAGPGGAGQHFNVTARLVAGSGQSVQYRVTTTVLGSDDVSAGGTDWSKNASFRNDKKGILWPPTSSLTGLADRTKTLTLWKMTTTGSEKVHVSDVLKQGTLVLEVWVGPPGEKESKLAASLWMTNFGQTKFTLNARGETFEAVSSVGALFTGANGNYMMTSAPPLTPPQVAGGTHRFFLRTINVTGFGSFGGSGRFDALLSLQQTSKLAGYDCRYDDLSTCARDVRLYIDGALKNAWETYFLGRTDLADGTGGAYRFKEIPAGKVGAEDPGYLYECECTGFTSALTADKGFAFTYVHSEVRAT